jgi:UDP-N-acetylglucosamine 2-epimerase
MKKWAWNMLDKLIFQLFVPCHLWNWWADATSSWRISGGIQEEAPSMGKPVLVLRDTTERPEALDAGGVRLIGTDRARIVEEVSRLLTDSATYQAMCQVHNAFGDGQAARRIVDVILAGWGVERWRMWRDFPWRIPIGTTAKQGRQVADEAI